MQQGKLNLAQPDTENAAEGQGSLSADVSECLQRYHQLFESIDGYSLDERVEKLMQVPCPELLLHPLEAVMATYKKFCLDYKLPTQVRQEVLMVSRLAIRMPAEELIAAYHREYLTEEDMLWVIEMTLHYLEKIPGKFRYLQ